MWGLAGGFSEAELENSITDQLTSFLYRYQVGHPGVFGIIPPRSGRLSSSKPA
jgi:hypothetical protein